MNVGSNPAMEWHPFQECIMLQKPVMHQPDNWQLISFSESLQIFLQNIKTNLLYWVLFHRSILLLLLMLLLVPSHLTHPIYSNQTSLLLTNGHLIHQAPDKRVTNLVRTGKDSWSTYCSIVHEQTQLETVSVQLSMPKTTGKCLITSRVSLRGSVKRM